MLRRSSKVRCLLVSHSQILTPTAGLSREDAFRSLRQLSSHLSLRDHHHNHVLNASTLRRSFSSTSNDQSTSSSLEPSETSSVEDTLEKLFRESQQQLADTTAAANGADAWYGGAENLWEPVWYNVADHAVLTLKYFHDWTGLEYGWSIVGVTVIIRLLMFPLMVQAQRTASRMAHVNPELTLLRKRYEAIATPSRQDQLQLTKQMQSLFAKYKVKPFTAFIGPIVQLPVFMGMFFGVQKMPKLFPTELSTGGMFWFADLTVPDPTYLLPLASSLTFWVLVEMGKEQMMAQNAEQGKIFINVFRAMTVAMVPFTVSFDAATLCYWTTTNTLTVMQTFLLKSESVKKYFGIWDPPKPVPGMQAESISQVASNLFQQVQGKSVLSEAERMKQNNQAIENKKRAFQMVRASRERKKGISGTKV